MRLRLFHWKAEEAGPVIAELEDAGHTVDYHGKLAAYRTVRESPPDVVLIDLSWLPPGRELAVFLRKAPCHSAFDYRVHRRRSGKAGAHPPPAAGCHLRSLLFPDPRLAALDLGLPIAVSFK